MKAKQWLSDNGYKINSPLKVYTELNDMINLMEQFLKESTEQPSQPEEKAERYFQNMRNHLRDYNEVYTPWINEIIKLAKSEPSQPEPKYAFPDLDTSLASRLPDYKRKTRPSQPEPKEVKSAEEILYEETSKSMTEYIAGHEDLHGCIIDAIHEYASQFPKVVLPTEEQMKSKSFECGKNAHDYIDGFNNCYKWIKEYLNK